MAKKQRVTAVTSSASEVIAYVPADETGKLALNEQVNMLTDFDRRVTLTSEQIDQMSMAEVGDALEASSKPKPKNSPKNERQKQAAAAAAAAVKPAEEKPAFQIFSDPQQPDTFDASVRLDAFYPLDATGIPGASSAMRGITKSWVEHLRLQAEYGGWPDSGWNFKDPVYVVASNHGPVPWDGNHRWEAYVAELARILDIDLKDKDWRKNATLVARMHETYVPVRVTNRVNGTPVTDGDLLALAFTANFMHGMNASTYGRTNYAIFLLDESAKRGTPIRPIDACRMTGVTKFALSMAMGRAKDKLEKEKKQPASLSYLDVEQNEEIDELRETRDIEVADQQLSNAVKALINAASILGDLLSFDAESLATLLDDKLEGKKRSDQLEALRFAVEAVGIVSENDIAHAEAIAASAIAQEAAVQSGDEESKVPTGPLQ